MDCGELVRTWIRTKWRISPCLRRRFLHGMQRVRSSSLLSLHNVFQPRWQSVPTNAPGSRHAILGFADARATRSSSNKRSAAGMARRHNGEGRLRCRPDKYLKEFQVDLPCGLKGKRRKRSSMMRCHKP
jgi:hypothetical protein